MKWRSSSSQLQSQSILKAVITVPQLRWSEQQVLLNGHSVSMLRMHGTSPGCRERSNAVDGTPKLNRLTCFVAMLPKAFRTAQARAEKVEQYQNGGTTSHWACLADTHPMNAIGAIRGRLLASDCQAMKNRRAHSDADLIPPERLALI